MSNLFKSKGGPQSIGQGDHAIGSQTNNHGTVISTSGDQSPAIQGRDITVNYNNMPPDWMQYAEEFGVTKEALFNFFRILEQAKVSSWDLDSKLREIAFRHKELLLRFESVTSDDPQVQALKEQAGQAIAGGEYDRADALLNQAKERDRAAVSKMKASLAEQQAALEMRQLSEAASCVEQADLQRLQYRYEKSAQYWQEAAAALPEERKKERANYLGAVGNDLYSISRYAEALSFFKQSLFVSHEIGDRKEEAKSLNNISMIYQAQGDYGKALDYLEQSLPIRREVGDKEGEGATLHNIAMTYHAKGDYPQALKQLAQSLLLQREMQDKEGEGGTLNIIGLIHYAQGDYAAAQQYCQQALTVARERKDKATESSMLNNISTACYAQGNYDAALVYAEQGLAIRQHIGDRQGEAESLNNTAAIYKAKGDYAAALKQYEQVLAIAKEIGNKDGESTYSWNIGWLYKKQGELAKAEPYLSRAVELEEQLEHPDLENDREELAAVRAKLRGR